MPLSPIQKSQIRYHLEYPNIGLATDGNGGGTLGSNASFFFNEYQSILEARMNAMQPTDEAVITGYAYGVLVLEGLDPNSGDTVTLTISGGNLSAPQSVIATAVTGSTKANMAAQLASAVARNANLTSAGFEVLSPYGPGSEVIDPEVELSLTSPVPFNLSVTFTGAIAATVINPGSQLGGPQATVGKNQGTPIVLNGLLPILNYLDGAVAGTTVRQGVRKADVFTAAPNELEQREKLYGRWQKRLASFFAVPVNPKSYASESANNVVRL
jgi:hypothetical protein